MSDDVERLLKSMSSTDFFSSAVRAVLNHPLVGAGAAEDEMPLLTLVDMDLSAEPLVTPWALRGGYASSRNKCTHHE